MEKADLRGHPYFTAYPDPVTGVESFVLTERKAPFQKGFYFVNSELSEAGKKVWFEAYYPPNPQKVLGWVSLDPLKPEIRILPEAAFFAETPLLKPDDGGVYFGLENRIHECDYEGRVRLVGEIPESYVARRQFRRVATHLTLSADDPAGLAATSVPRPQPPLQKMVRGGSGSISLERTGETG